MRHCSETGRDYPRIRVLGTLGWIVAGLANSGLGIEFGPQPMWIASAVSIALGLYCFTLPATPPQAGTGAGHRSIGSVLGLPALQLMRNRSFAVLSVSALFVTLPFAMYHPVTNMYLNESGVTGVAAKMTLAQAAEVVFMLLIPFSLLRLGIKRMLLLGMSAWVIRFALFAAGNAGDRMILLYGGILLHGICYDFFYVTAQIYMDKKAPSELRASVQGFFTLLTFGAGWLLGSFLTGGVLQHFQITDAGAHVIGHHWQPILLIPAGIALVVALVFALTFKDDGEKPALASPRL
jgi:nucleoside transporter